MRRLAFAAFVRAGVHALRLPPAAVWDLTPAELASLLGAPPAARTPRAALDDLMRRFPDTQAERGHPTHDR
ncbi:phage tail assembly chaperone [Futiania mangrovi]|uniref:Phage tail assembly chaperone n=1 Tax=Futiania mangrovi TaxID=2959716 RepID=A0A9J6PAY8_9PROT|nr:phage tail assembly chaperone [Futiania mangrovii]MCP1337276.1 phage tail assembly chaperone [Futiania mangrovii]